MKFLMVFDRGNEGLWATYVHGDEKMDQAAALVFISDRFKSGLAPENKPILYVPAEGALVNGNYSDHGTWLKDAERALVREFLAKPKYADPSAMRDAQALAVKRTPAREKPLEKIKGLEGWTMTKSCEDPDAAGPQGHPLQRTADADQCVIWGAK